jgi:serine/threonine-protein kinase
MVDKYRIIRLLGRGGMGSVYESHHATLERRFAIKFMLPEYAANREILRRFENEAKAAGRLEHANIAAVTDFGRAQDASPYLVMEYLSGQDCAKLLASLGPLPVARAANLVFQACFGLAVAHKAGIVHRDIKPENLFVTDAGDGSDLVKVLDFGIAKLRTPNASAVTGSGTAMGTFFYMSPEQVRDAGKVDERADVWALGVVLYELLTARKPFDGTDATKIMYQIVFEQPEPLGKLRPELPPELTALIEKAIRKDPSERFASVMNLAEAIGPFTGRSTLRPAGAASEKPASKRTRASAPNVIHVTTSHASVATLSTISSSPSNKSATLRRVVIAAAVALVVAVIGTIAWNSSHTASATSRVAASSMELPTAQVPAMAGSAVQPLEKPASDSRVPSLLPSTPASTVAAASSVRTISEHAAPTSNKPRLSDDRKLKPAATEASAREKTVDPSAAPERVPEKPSTSKHTPISIDTSSPF